MILRIFDYISLALTLLVVVPINIAYLLLIFVSFVLCRPVLSFTIIKDLICHKEINNDTG